MTGFQNFLFYLVPLLLIPEPAWIFSRFEVGMPPSGIQRDFRTGKKSWAHHYSNRKRARGERTFSSSRHVSSLEQRLSIKFPTLVPTNTLCSLPKPSIPHHTHLIAEQLFAPIPLSRGSIL